MSAIHPYAIALVSGILNLFKGSTDSQAPKEAYLNQRFCNVGGVQALCLYPGWPQQRENGENTGNLGTTQGKFAQHRIFQISLKMKYFFLVNCPFIDWCTPIFFWPCFAQHLSTDFHHFNVFLHISVQFLVWHVKLNIHEREEVMALMGWWRPFTN